MADWADGGLGRVVSPAGRIADPDRWVAKRGRSVGLGGRGGGWPSGGVPVRGVWVGKWRGMSLARTAPGKVSANFSQRGGCVGAAPRQGAGQDALGRVRASLRRDQRCHTALRMADRANCFGHVCPLRRFTGSGADLQGGWCGRLWPRCRGMDGRDAVRNPPLWCWATGRRLRGAKGACITARRFKLGGRAECGGSLSRVWEWLHRWRAG